MARTKHSSPTLTLRITEYNRHTAIESNSGGCLIADAIKRQYPHLSGITVDMATIAVTDRKRGERYTYLTTPAAQHVLLAFDQGWGASEETLVIKRAVQILPVRTTTRRKVTHAERLAELEALEAEGAPMTRQQKAGLTRLRKSPTPNRAINPGPADVKIDNGGAVIRGGRPRVQGDAHPNLLRGRNRHFGAKLADPGKAWHEALEQAVLAKQQETPS